MARKWSEVLAFYLIDAEHRVHAEDEKMVLLVHRVTGLQSASRTGSLRSYSRTASGHSMLWKGLMIGSAGIHAPNYGSALKVTDPKDQLGDGGGTWVYLNAEELVRVNGVAGSFENRLRLAETAKHIANFPSRRRVKDGRVAELVQEIADLFPGLGKLPAFRQRDGCDVDVGPIARGGVRRSSAAPAAPRP